jgi:plasmid stabilization system protein ParE
VKYRVRFARSAIEDLVWLTEYLVRQSPERAHEAEPTIRNAVGVLCRLPFVGRPAQQQKDVSLRELLVPFGATGYVILYRVGPGRVVSVLAARHQVEARYH